MQGRFLLFVFVSVCCEPFSGIQGIGLPETYNRGLQSSTAGFKGIVEGLFMNAYHVLVIFIDRKTKYILSAAADIRFALSESMAFAEYAAQLRTNFALNGHDASGYVIVPIRVSRISEQLIQSAYIMVLSKSLAAFESHKSTVELAQDQENIALCGACGGVGHTWEHCAVLSTLRAEAAQANNEDTRPDGPSTPPGPFRDFFGSLGDLLDNDGGDKE